MAPARLDRRTKNLTKRLQPGDIAVIDHADLDRVSAESMLRCNVAAVLNAAPSITGRYPNLGPQLLVEAGVPLIDDVGPDVFDKVADGKLVRLDGDTLYVADAIVAKGTVQTAESVSAAMTKAKAGLSDQIRAFMANTVEYISRDFEVLIDGIRIPELRTKLEGKHALVIARGYRHHEDLLALRAYTREF
ncbi:MAG: putative cytokinetic ring protein SteA, partial [Streptosporangiaceae bacterium]